jgi:hypothetical protein
MPSRVLQALGLALGLVGGLAVGCATADGPRAAACRTDADCVPATCCHATECTTASAAPKCEGVACTMDCRDGTLDCGGRCVCDAGRCAARPNTTR